MRFLYFKIISLTLAISEEKIYLLAKVEKDAEMDLNIELGNFRCPKCHKLLIKDKKIKCNRCKQEYYILV